MEVEQGLPLQASHLVMSLHIVFRVQWLSSLMQHQGAPGKLLINADFLGRPEVLNQRPGRGSELGGFIKGSEESSFPWASDHTWENPIWGKSPALAG